MTEELADVLASIDDPETVQQILGTMSSDGSSDASPSTQSTLTDLYERYLNRREKRSPATLVKDKRKSQS